MSRLNLIEKVQARKQEIKITSDNIAEILHLDIDCVNDFFNNKDVELDVIQNISNILGLDSDGNEVIDIKTLKNNRANEKALYIISLVQDTSSLEMQGLENDDLNILLQETKEQFLSGEYQNFLWES